MKKLFFALALSLVGLFFSNFIIPSSANVEETEVVNSMLPYQTIFIKNTSGVDRTVDVDINNGSVTFSLDDDEVWSGTFTGNSVTVSMSSIVPPINPGAWQASLTYKMYETPSDVRPICHENHTFNPSETFEEFNCFTNPD